MCGQEYRVIKKYCVFDVDAHEDGGAMNEGETVHCYEKAVQEDGKWENYSIHRERFWCKSSEH